MGKINPLIAFVDESGQDLSISPAYLEMIVSQQLALGATEEDLLTRLMRLSNAVEKLWPGYLDKLRRKATKKREERKQKEIENQKRMDRRDKKHTVEDLKVPRQDEKDKQSKKNDPQKDFKNSKDPKSEKKPISDPLKNPENALELYRRWVEDLRKSDKNKNEISDARLLDEIAIYLTWTQYMQGSQPQGTIPPANLFNHKGAACYQVWGNIGDTVLEQEIVSYEASHPGPDGQSPSPALRPTPFKRKR